ncbi:N-acetylmuramoyl-L-alanine amidase [Ectothiorhodospiraceae bacterium 2226]|nr:N-acetylmuramoyl-L-alanine amidase [Ectothiorhodospiraceae bacterium 2226]
MVRLAKTICVLWLSLILLTPAYADVQVQALRMWPAPESTRVVMDLSGPADYHVFTLDNPPRVVVDLKRARLTRPVSGMSYERSLLRDIRTAVRDGGGLRVVLDMRDNVRPESFVLPPNQGYGHRLVIDLHPQRTRTVARQVPTRPPAQNRDIIVAIDAGHGGEDPGAIGPSGTYEKDVVLAIARALQQLVDREPGMRALMIRDGDYYISLRERVERARAGRADLFISVHADAFHDQRARGSSVFVLSDRGASSEAAKWLAKRENAADLVGGVRLDDKDDLLASVLLDLSQSASLEASTEVAQRVLEGLKRAGTVRKRQVEHAGFAVLRSPDIPSILVETAFISNPEEERKLRDARQQRALAQAMMDGIRAYFMRNPPPDTLWAQRGRRHVIAQGETLSVIAQRYSVSLDNLRQANGLNGDLVQVGDVLRIPYAGGG